MIGIETEVVVVTEDKIRIVTVEGTIEIVVNLLEGSETVVVAVLVEVGIVMAIAVVDTEEIVVTAGIVAVTEVEVGTVQVVQDQEVGTGAVVALEAEDGTETVVESCNFHELSLLKFHTICFHDIRLFICCLICLISMMLSLKVPFFF